jgi:alanyl-tRNA synthetase
MEVTPEKLEWPVSRVRQTFVDYFVEKQQHLHVRSSSVVPHDDPTLLFANAGMNQFKPIFLGQVDPKSEQANWKRAANSQKCIRAGGKHNDLEDVGKDTYHHTFFEMLGNWSFGDYFKEEAIAWAWELLTVVYGLPPERLYATYFRGDEEDGLAADDEARAIWLKYLPADRVLPYGRKENFWEMGATGPCGPCSEIHFDRLGGRDASALVNADDPTVIEIWNLVFIQFNREDDGKLKPLPARHVDTGMGLERITSILQKKLSNYDTDVFTPIFARIQEITGAAPYGGRVGAEDVDTRDMAYRVVADHIRTLSLAINDGAVPGAAGRNYVVRRVLRRAVRYGKQILGAQDGFFHKLVPVVVESLGDAFPELRRDPAHLTQTIKEEEITFTKTLDKGLKKFAKATEKLQPGDTIDGKIAFRLYDTYGFPLDLTALMAEEKGLKVDKAGFKAEKLAQRIRSQGAVTSVQKAALALGTHAVAHLQGLPVAPTDDAAKYVDAGANATVRAIWTGKEFADSVSDAAAGVVLDRTNFYSESGGQVADTGVIKTADGGATGAQSVEDVQAYGGYVVHMGVIKGTLKVGDAVHLSLDLPRRLSLKSNHTSTHLVNHALREVLGAHVEQKGSLVQPERLRFDFSHTKPVSGEQLAAVDKLVLGQIAQDLPVDAKEVPLKQALSINGIRAVFGETYPDPVRVVVAGPTVDELLAEPSNPEWKKYAIELCGGTHLARTAEAGSFAVVGEEALARGVRRVVAFTGDAARQAVARADELQRRIDAAGALKGIELEEEIKRLDKAINDSEQPIPAARQVQFRALLDKLRGSAFAASKNSKAEQLEAAQQYAEKVLAALGEATAEKAHVGQLDVGSNVIALTNAIKAIRAKHPHLAVLLLSAEEVKGKGKITVVTQASDDLVAAGLKANEWAAAVATLLGGKGGGKPQTAQGSGSDLTKVSDALALARSYVHDKLH